MYYRKGRKGLCGSVRFLWGSMGWLNVCVHYLHLVNGNCALTAQVASSVFSLSCVVLIILSYFHFFYHWITLAQLTLALKIGMDFVPWEHLDDGKWAMPMMPPISPAPHQTLFLSLSASHGGWGLPWGFFKVCYIIWSRAYSITRVSSLREYHQAR